jgi:AraC family transcriptional regulator
MSHYLELLSIQTPKHQRKGLENRTRFDCRDFEINIFETFQPSTKVQIRYEGLSVSSMIRGHKIVYTKTDRSFDFTPGTSLILPEGETIYADFPNANEKTPAQCATILIPTNTLHKQLNYLNAQYAHAHNRWEIDVNTFHFNNNSGLVRSFNELLHTASQQSINYALTDLLLKSFLIRIMEAQIAYKTELNQLESNPQLFLIKKHIKENLHQPISIEDLMTVGNCSKSSLHRMFENYCEKTPGAYILQERMINSSNLLLQPGSTVSEVAYQSGYNSVSYFVKQFKIYHHCTPGDFIRKFRK